MPQKASISAQTQRDHRIDRAFHSVFARSDPCSVRRTWLAAIIASVSPRRRALRAHHRPARIGDRSAHGGAAPTETGVQALTSPAAATPALLAKCRESPCPHATTSTSRAFHASCPQNIEYRTGSNEYNLIVPKFQTAEQECGDGEDVVDVYAPAELAAQFSTPS
jgi:hypothetical protein